MFKILLFLLSFLSTYVVADEIKKIEILGNERISDNTILMFSDVGSSSLAKRDYPELTNDIFTFKDFIPT